LPSDKFGCRCKAGFPQKAEQQFVTIRSIPWGFKRRPYRHILCPYKACNGVEVARKWPDDPLSREGDKSSALVSEEVLRKIEVVF
jgi:hypothetical protein